MSLRDRAHRRGGMLDERVEALSVFGFASFIGMILGVAGWALIGDEHLAEVSRDVAGVSLFSLVASILIGNIARGARERNERVMIDRRWI